MWLYDGTPCPCVITLDRYNGVYSGGKWTAFNEWSVPPGAEDSDMECQEFWDSYKNPVGKGATPADAFQDLVKQLEAKDDGK